MVVNLVRLKREALQKVAQVKCDIADGNKLSIKVIPSDQRQELPGNAAHAIVRRVRLSARFNRRDTHPTIVVHQGVSGARS